MLITEAKITKHRYLTHIRQVLWTRLIMAYYVSGTEDAKELRQFNSNLSPEDFVFTSTDSHCCFVISQEWIATLSFFFPI